MKEWDWKRKFKETHETEKWKWVQSVQNDPVTEEEFVEKMSAFPRKGKHPGKKYSPSNCRKWYKHLKEEFGFFKS